MDFSKVKLVVTDMDGTLLNSESKISDHFLGLYKQLKKNNIKFIAASGRQYFSIVDRFDKSIQDEITIIAENGAFAMRGNKELFTLELPTAYISKSIEILRKVKNAQIVLCGKKAAYIETENEAFISMFKNYYSEYTLVDDLTKVTDDTFFKIAAFHFECSETYIYPSVKQLENELQVIVSGKNWLDISHNNANKGYALNIFQKELNIAKEETMVFGDYNNDLKMLELADFSYAMENAHQNVKNIANFLTKTNDESGVECILEQVINSRTI
ncbi:Cof-type HAD-IIB family hydrolase [Lutibacter sp. A64]|uniref:HAD family hydrolase n=1 Tax=Lutibacter sp. A64 TaxID=2918526 RepID=UPI001F05C7CF|nr:HAD family hydrolase [Lutibacter sp. A64]UMB53374.1 Cof-type HAD-IIB family hydrolase [Lutibacter sp. A64]